MLFLAKLQNLLSDPGPAPVRAVAEPSVPERKPTVKEGDAVQSTIAKHVRVIDNNLQAINEIEHAHHARVGDLEAKKSEAGRLYRHLLDDIEREMKRSEETAQRSIALRRVLIRSSQAALESFKRAEPEPAPERTTIPITRHTNIRS